MTRQTAETLQRYYDLIASEKPDLFFLSPCDLPGQAAEYARWLSQADRTAMELGPGLGIVVSHLCRAPGELQRFVIADVSPGFIDNARRLWTRQHPSIEGWVVEDPETAPPERVRDMDRLLAINVMQDNEPCAFLRLANRVLRLHGRLRFTSILRETMDEYYADHPSYDRAAGRYYSRSELHFAHGTQPLGRRAIHGVEHTYYREQRFCFAEETSELLARSGFRFLSCSPVTFPVSHMRERWTKQGYLDDIPEKVWQLMERDRGYPDSLDIVAEKVESLTPTDLTEAETPGEDASCAHN